MCRKHLGKLSDNPPQPPACLDCENVRYGDMTVQDASVGFIFKGKANARAAAELRSVIYAVTGDSGEVKQFEYIKFSSCYNLCPDA